MSTTPLQWRKNVVSHYGSIAAFPDKTTIEIVRDQIEANRADLKEVFDLEDAHPGIMNIEDLKREKEKDANLVSLDEELKRWLEANRKASA